MKLGRFLKRTVVTAASLMQAKRMLDERNAPSVEMPKPSTAPCLLGGGPYRGQSTRPSCTGCHDAVVAWCVICARPIELGERIFCPSKKELTARELGEGLPLYEIAAPKDHVHQKCAFDFSVRMFTNAITDITGN